VIATVADVIACLEDASRSQRDKLAALRDQADAIRALHDDDHERALREIRRRLRSPKLAGEVERLLDLLLDRRPNPRPPGEAPPDGAAPDDPAAAFEAAIAADPDAPGPYAVYADFLQERGHPLGALIAIGQELLRQPRSAALHAAHRDHLAAHRDRLLGPAACEDALLEADWFMGFLRGCRIAPRGRQVDLGLVARWLLERPGAARFLQKLVVGIGARDDGAYGRVCAVLARRPRPTLRTLALGDYQSETFEPAPANAAALWPMLPGLRELIVRHPQIALAPLRLPALERLSVRVAAADFPVLALGADVPALERLAVRLEVPVPWRGEQARLESAGLAAALRALRLPRLRSLAITAAGCGDQLCELLAGVPLLAQLEELDLSASGLGDAGAAAIHARRAAFRHLRLVVDWHHLSAEGRALLEAGVAELALGDPAYGGEY
jgi:uncharacterized protein (TIGR02996 family)